MFTNPSEEGRKISYTPIFSQTLPTYILSNTLTLTKSLLSFHNDEQRLTLTINNQIPIYLHPLNQTFLPRLSPSHTLITTSVPSISGFRKSTPRFAVTPFSEGEEEAVEWRS